MKSLLVSLLLAIGLVSLAHATKAQDYSKIRIVRLSFVEGTVQYQRPGEDWQVAGLSLPIREGFSLRTVDGYAEVEFESSLKLRLANNSTVEFTGLALRDGGRLTHLTIPQGTALVIARPENGDAVSVAAPNLNLNLTKNGTFRMDVAPTGSWVRLLDGKVEADSRAGANSHLTGGHTLHVDVSGLGTSEVSGNPPRDDFDNWSLIVKKSKLRGKGRLSAEKLN